MKNLVLTMISLAFLLGGLYLFGLAPSASGKEVLVMLGGLLSMTAAFALPFWALPRTERQDASD